jgi:hypothetical protein
MRSDVCANTACLYPSETVGSIDEAALNSLSLVVELTKHIKTKSEKESNEPETGETFASFFPGFLWVVRDFTLQLVDEHNAPISAKAYLDRALRPMQGFSEGVEVKNRIRRMLQGKAIYRIYCADRASSHRKTDLYSP